MKKFIYQSLLLGAVVFAVSCDSSSDKNDDETQDPTEARYTHKVLIEDTTGTWCQYCPRVSYALQQAKSNEANGENVVAIAFHLGISNYPDPMQIAGGQPLYNFFSSKGLTGLPFAIINRDKVWRAPEPNNLAQAFDAINQEGSSVGIKISSDLSTNGGKVSASFKFSEGYEDLKYTIFVIEHDVVTPQSPQQNTTSYFGGTRVDKDFVHQDVLRGFSGSITGNELGSVTPGEEVKFENQEVSFNLFNNDLSKVEVVVFVSDADNKVLNVQNTYANQTIDYQLVE